MDIETRTLPGKVELRQEGDAAPVLVGTAIQWDTWSVDLGGFKERFARGAVAWDKDFRVIDQHDNTRVWGRMGAGTARLTIDDFGAHYEADPPDTQWARDSMASIKRSDIYQNSFSFCVAEPVEQNQVWGLEPDGTTTRTVLRAHVYEMGPQTTPAYPTTSVALRSLDEARKAGMVVGIAPAVSPDVLAEQARLAERIAAGFDAGA